MIKKMTAATVPFSWGQKSKNGSTKMSVRPNLVTKMPVRPNLVTKSQFYDKMPVTCQVRVCQNASIKNARKRVGQFRQSHDP